MREAWHLKPRKVCVLVDNNSWIIPYAKKLVTKINKEGDKAKFIRKHEDVNKNDICFMLGCTKIMRGEILKKCYKSLIVHESSLPMGKGFSPLSWQIIEGKKKIPVCLLEASKKVDSGDIIYKEFIHFQGHELNPELRHKQGNVSIKLCLKFLRSKFLPKGFSQKGKESFYKRRTPDDSEIDPNKSIKSQFNLLRIVDNVNYPAFFELNGVRYNLTISKSKK